MPLNLHGLQCGWSRLRPALAAVGLFLHSHGLLPAETPAAAPDVVARGKGWTVPRPDLDGALTRVRAEAALRGKPLTEAQAAALRPQLLDQLILMRLCEARSEEADRAIARGNARRFIEGLKNKLGADGFRRLMTSAGYPDEASLERDKYAEALVTAVIDREVKTTIRIPTQDVREYYESNADKWLTPASVRYLHLALPRGGAAGGEVDAAARKRVEGWRRELEAGKDFAAVLRTVTAGEQPLATGGEESAVIGQLAPEVEEVVFHLSPGTLSRVVETADGYHLYRILERVPATRLPLAKVEEDIRALLVQRETALRLPEYVKRIRSAASVEILETPPSR